MKLRKYKLQEADRVEEQLLTVLRMVDKISEKQNEQEVIAAMKRGKDALQILHDEMGIVVKHFIDSMSPLRYIPSYSSILDIGSGGGFPGIPLKIVNPTFRVTLLESTLKKVNFQKHIIRALKLDEIVAIHGRAEDQELHKRIGAPFDVVISRAFSDLKNFLEVAEPCMKRRGHIIAMRGRNVKEEIFDNKEKIKNLKLDVEDLNEFYLPYLKEKRSIIVFSKKSTSEHLKWGIFV